MSKNHTSGVKRSISPLLRIDQVAELLGCSERTVRNLHREGRLPQRSAISERLVGWRENELEAWLSSRREDDTDV